ncbi:5-formaminoimidazole-4-carboxamide-1-(beta)-D-ribofuranosyl 5'-monophosphate synthetase [Candidatus Anstonella stagnisolia]|nr:5-formaminoimidazole-4-carboxamide-1-(beta)-D-ribofuranosyl 5'-monophosphate synthetase [Candidatus Anstonella stagnisolia]
MDRNEICKLAASYKSPCVAVLGSHSALDISSGARDEGLRSIVVCQKGRELTYKKYFTKRKMLGRDAGSIDELMLLEKFSDIAKKPAIEKLQKAQALFVPHRSFSVYVGYDAIENDFTVPIFGNRNLLRAEERNTPKNQHYLLQKAGVRVPKTFSKPEQIDRLVIVKTPEAKRTYERAFFFASNYETYKEESEKLLKNGTITQDGLKNALIEEFVLGAQFNFNYFASPLTGEIELLGIDTRRQTNLDGLLRLPAYEQNKLGTAVQSGALRINNIEVGHIACTLRESLLDSVYEMGEKFAATCKKEYAPGLIGPFALQGAITSEENGEKPVIFDVSFRVPGSPGTRFTPYSAYLWGENMSVGKRIAIEIKEAAKAKRLGEIVT